ncbi:MAG: SdpI family protein [Candidatus Micrarchaeota archaeon]|nr:SdpI family protein [Candidatus Micrarchaeota archaeon]
MSIYRELLPLAIIALMFGIAFYAAPRLVEREEFSGAWVAGIELGKTTVAYAIPIIALAIYLGLLLIPKIEVYQKNLEDFSDQFWGFKVVMVFAMCIIYLSLLMPSLGYWTFSDPTILIVPAIALVFFYVGYMLNFTKRNYFVGIGTPWTLASEKIWERTNHLGSRLFWGLGIVSMLLLVAPPPSRLWAIVCLFAVVLIGLYIYSLWEYKKAKKNHERQMKVKRRR